MKFLKENEKLWKQTEKLDSFLGRAGEFDAIFFVGGHGRECSLYSQVSCLYFGSIEFLVGSCQVLSGLV